MGEPAGHSGACHGKEPEVHRDEPDFACLHESRMSDITDSTTVSLMLCTLSLTVCKCTPCHRASFNSTTDSFSWGHDPYTLACKARPSSDRCWTSLSVSLCPQGKSALSVQRSCHQRTWNSRQFTGQRC